MNAQALSALTMATKNNQSTLSVTDVARSKELADLTGPDVVAREMAGL